MLSKFLRLDKWAYKLLFWIIVFGSFVFWVNNGYASTFQTYDVVALGTNVSFTSAGLATGNPLQRFHVTSSTEGTLISLIIAYNCGTVPCNIGNLTLRNRSTSVSYTLTIGNQTTQFTQYVPSSDTPLVAGQDYELFFNNYSVLGHTPSTTYTNTAGWDVTGRRTSIPNGTFTTNASYNFDIYVRMTIEPTVSNEVDFVYPAPTSTLTCDFSSWQLNYSIDGDTVATLANGDYGLTVMWGLDPFLMFNQDYAIFSDWYSGTSTVAVNAHDFLPKATPLVPGYTYSAQAFICDSTVQSECDFSLSSNDSHIIAEGPVWEFIIDDPSAPLLSCPAGGAQVPYPGFVGLTATSTLWGDNLTCDPDSDFFSRGMCALFQFLFIPNTTALSQFSNLQAQVQQKAPFGYISVYNDQIEALSSASSTTSTAWSSVSSSQYLNLSTWGNLSVFAYIRTILTWFMWFVFVFYMYHRFRNFSLHG